MLNDAVELQRLGFLPSGMIRDLDEGQEILVQLTRTPFVGTGGHRCM